MTLFINKKKSYNPLLYAINFLKLKKKGYTGQTSLTQGLII